MALDRVLPVIDLRTARLNERGDGLEAVRRLQRPAQHAVHPEAMQRQGLVQAFRQTAGRGSERWTLSAGQLIDIVKWNLLRHIPVKMRGGRR